MQATVVVGGQGAPGGAGIDAGLEDKIQVIQENDFKEWVQIDSLRYVVKGIIDEWMRKKDSTALFVDNDWLAYEIMNQSGDYGIRIPQDLSLMGIGDYAFSSFSFVGLSTVSSQKQKPMGVGAATMLKSLLNETETNGQDIILPVEVKLRSTTKTLS